MEPKLFQKSTAGRCIRTLTDYYAFIPNPLPPEIKFENQLIQLLSEADRKLGELSGVGHLLTNPHLLIAPCIYPEAVLSSRIENTQAGMDDLFLFQADETSLPQVPDVKEVANYIQALKYGLERIKNLPLSGRLVREIHERLMEGVSGKHAAPGGFRTTQNWIGPPGCTLNEATFIPPPVEEMKTALSDWEKYLNYEAKEPPLIQCALMHYQFEAIHPFVDGNGRIGRLLIILMLCERRILTQPLLYLSAFFERNRDEYYHRLLRVSQEGDWRGWIEFFLRGVSIQAEESIHSAKKWTTLHEEFRKRIAGKRIPGTASLLVDQLFENPIISPSRLARKLNHSYQGLMRGIHFLKKQGILQEMTGKSRNRLFTAPELINLIVTEQTRSLKSILP